MFFPTFEFFAFFTIVLTLNWLLKKWPLLWRLFLLLSSYFFYYLWDIRFLIILIIISFLNFFGGWFIYKTKGVQKAIFLLIIVLNLSFLAFFKYYDFFRVSFESLFEKVNLSFSLPFLEIILPIGISFYIFRIISYIIDIYLKRITPSLSIIDFFIYVAFFPYILCGPITRFKDFVIQLNNGGAKKIENLYYYVTLIFLGLFKKIVISSYLVIGITDDILTVPENYSSFLILLAVFSYSLVIYFDFSGYSDMAIGFAGLLGFKSPINFDTPYLSLNIQDFWRKWHITLSNWIRDYVYIPLGGNHKGSLRKYLNLMIAMMLAGLWHGPRINFLIWGIINGLALIVFHFYQDFKNRFFPKDKEKFNFILLIKKNKLKEKIKILIKKLFCWFITFSFISFSWIFFRSETSKDALEIIKYILGSEKSIELFRIYLLLLVAVGFLLFLFEKKIIENAVKIQEKTPLFIWIFLMVGGMILIFKLGPDTLPPFIYFGF